MTVEFLFIVWTDVTCCCRFKFETTQLTSVNIGLP